MLLDVGSRLPYGGFYLLHSVLIASRRHEITLGLTLGVRGSTPPVTVTFCPTSPLKDADEEDYEGMEGDEDDEGAGDGAAGDSGAGPALQAVQEDQEVMDEGVQSQLPDMAKRRCARHTDSAVAIGWSPKQPQVVVSGGCDDHAYLWRVEQEGMLRLYSAS